MKKNYLALGGLFAALHLLFVFLSKLIVGSELILVIFLPLLSTIYALKFNIKESAIFFIATFFLCFIFEPVSTGIYVLPALLCGSVYGMARKKGMKEMSLIYISSLAHSISVTISFVFIAIMFKEINFFSIFATFINKQGNELYVCIYLILLLLGVIEAFITHIISNEELKKVGYKSLNGELSTPLWITVLFSVVSVVYIVLIIIDPLLSCYCLPFVIAFMIPNIVEFIIRGENKWIYIIVGIITIVSFFVLKYVDSIVYPALLILMFFPMVMENFVRVLYTNSSKYSNKIKNRIE